MRIDFNAFEFYASNLDSGYCTEPILTGKLLYGDKKEYENIQKRIKNKKANPRVISYLLRRSYQEHLKAVEFVR